MKSKNWYIFAVCIVLSSPVSAERGTFNKRETIKDRNENWLANPPKNIIGGEGAFRSSGRPDLGNRDVEEPNDPYIKPSPDPIGDALPILLGFGLIYGVYLKQRKIAQK